MEMPITDGPMKSEKLMLYAGNGSLKRSNPELEMILCFWTIPRVKRHNRPTSYQTYVITNVRHNRPTS